MSNKTIYNSEQIVSIELSKMNEIKYSKYQINIFDFVKNKDGNCVIEAIAGSGKTFTIKELCKIIPKEKRVLFLAFNVSIVNELKEKIQQGNVTIRTSHSLGYLMLKTHFKYQKDGEIPLLEVDEYKYRNYFKKNFGEITATMEFKTKTDVELFKENVLNLIDLCRVYLCKTKEEIQNIGNKYGYFLTQDEIETLYHLIYWGTENLDTCDFTDMISLPSYLELNINSLKYDYVILDEAQDQSIAMQELMKKTMKKNGRFISVGDKMQCINTFCGSDEAAFEKFSNLPNTTKLPLSINYRCPKCIEKIARRYVPQFEVREDAPLGQINYNVLVKDIKDNSMVLCRNTAPLIELYLRLIKEGRKCYIKGADFLNDIISVIDKHDAYYISADLDSDGFIPQLYQKLFETRNKIMLGKKLDVYDATANSQVLNQYELINSIKTLAYAYNTNSVFELKMKIKKIFEQNKDTSGICLSTIHKAKGLENEYIYLLCPSLLPSKIAEKDWEIQAEKCLEYVMYTRTKNELNFISETDFPIPNNSNDVDFIISYLKSVEGALFNLYNNEQTEVKETNTNLYILPKSTTPEKKKRTKLKKIETDKNEQEDKSTIQDVYAKKKERFGKLLLGLTHEEAIDTLNDLNLKNTIRVVIKDGNPCIVTCDYIPDRLNITIENNLITNIELG
jgi:superfamily I DNA/RNA helicase